MGFKPMAFGLLSGDSPKEALQNAIGDTSVAGKLYMDDKKKREEEEAAKAAGAVQPKMVEGMKRGGKVSSASSRADGIAQRGKTRGKMY
jgi:hypothetical protein